MFDSTITLEQARDSAKKLSELQQGAAALPQLEFQAQKEQSQARLENLHTQTIKKLQSLSTEYQQALSDYKSDFDKLLRQMKQVSALLKWVKSLESQIEKTRSVYIGAYTRHNLRFKGDGSKADQLKNGVTYEIAASDSLPRVRTNLRLHPDFSFAQEIYHLLLKFKK